MESITAREWYLNNKEKLFPHNNQLKDFSSQKYIPSQQEIYEEVERQKKLGYFIETQSPCSMIDSSSNYKYQNSGNLSMVRTSQNRSRGPLSKPNYGKMFSSLLVVLLSTPVLISLSLNIFGYSWQGWFKAITIDLGIILLGSFKFPIQWRYEWDVLKEVGSWVLGRGTLALLIYMSFSVLHTDIQSTRLSWVQKAVKANTSLSDLINERDSWQTLHDDYARNRHSDKTHALTEISRLNNEIRIQKSRVPQNAVSSVINMRSDTEEMVRAVLLLLNIIFAHKFIKELASVKWPSLKKELCS